MTAPSPLTGDLTRITYRHRNATVEADGKLIAPGLILVPHADYTKRPRYVLLHAPSGKSLGAVCCAAHIGPVGEFAAGLPIDWTADSGTVSAGIKAGDMDAWAANVRCCPDWCESGDGPAPPSWGVSCDTCFWSWEDEYDEGPLDAKEAKQVAQDHKCEPRVTIKNPDTGEWHDPFWVNDDGTVRDPSARKVAAQ